ncbi:hypothetical protein GCM10009843_40320 [Nocardioides bigeumensis]|uniref:Uncharacterized protein n=1 Tax=Nocardioides bigeumensis TaxID=433657 RepID=A0ABP5KLA4_9ACTN
MTGRPLVRGDTFTATTDLALAGLDVPRPGWEIWGSIVMAARWPATRVVWVVSPVLVTGVASGAAPDEALRPVRAVTRSAAEARPAVVRAALDRRCKGSLSGRPGGGVPKV